MSKYDYTPEERTSVFNDGVVPKELRARAYYLINTKLTGGERRAQARMWVGGKLRRESDIRKLIEKLEAL